VQTGKVAVSLLVKLKMPCFTVCIGSLSTRRAHGHHRSVVGRLGDSRAAHYVEDQALDCIYNS